MTSEIIGPVSRISWTSDIRYRHLILSSIYYPVTNKLKKLNIWSGDRSFISIKNNISSAASALKETVRGEDIPKLMLYKKKYLNFRKETNSNFLSLQIVFSELDESLEELFDFFND